MNRREFSLLTAGISAAFGIDPLSAMGEFAPDPSEPGNPGEPLPPTAPRNRVALSVSGLFMQDYSLGNAWSADPQAGWAEPYVALDGSQHIFRVPFSDPGGDPGPAVERIFPAKGSLTGWDRQAINMGSAYGGAGAVNNTMVMVPSGTRPQGPALPGNTEDPNWDIALVYRRNSVERCMINPQGMLWSIERAAVKSNSYPLVTGQLDRDTKYIPEVSAVGAVVGDASLRSASNPGNSYMVLGTPFAGVATGPNPTKPARVFPLKGHPQSDTYRCITVDNLGNVCSLLLVYSQANHNFSVRENVVLAQSTSKCIHVHELVAGTVEIILFDVTGPTPGIRTIAGAYTPRSTQPATWQVAVTEPLVGFRLPFGAASSLEMVGAWHADLHTMDLFVMVRDSQDPNHKCEVWTTTRCHQQLWRQMLCVEKSCRTASVFRSQDTVKLLFTRALDAGGFQSEIWSRNPVGNWAIDAAVLPRTTGKPVVIPSYRVGVKFMQGGVSLALEPVQVSASVLSVATVNGHRTVLPTDNALEATTDATGTLWIVLPLENRLFFPTVTIASQRFGPRLILPLNKIISDKFAGIQAGDLTSAAKGEALLTGSSAGMANDLAQAMRSIVAAGTQDVALRGTAPVNVQVASTVDYFWEFLQPTGPSHPRPGGPAPPTNFTASVDGAPPPSPAWAITASGFQSISVDEARSRITSAIRTLVYASPTSSAPGTIPFNPTMRFSWSDITDAVEDAADWVGGRISDGISLLKDGAARLTGFIMDGATLLFKIVVNGIEYAYTGIVNTIETAMDAIHSLLRYAGLQLGKATGWLLSHLGFLFDWDGIKSRRNELKALVKNNVGKVAQWMPDPNVGAATINSRLTTVRAKLQSYKSAAGNATSISSKFPLFSGLPSLDDVGGAIGLPKLTMITDKIYGALEKVNQPLGAPAVSLGDQTTLMAKVGEVMNFIPGMVQRLVTAFDQWTSNSSSFLEATGSALADILLDEIDRLIQLLQELISFAAAGIKSLINSVSTILSWLDHDLDLGTLSGFYEGLTDNKLSLLDVACLGAAICYKEGAPAPHTVGTSRAAADTQSDARKARNAFLWVNVLTNSLDAFVSARFPGTSYSSFTTAMNLGPLAGAMICALVDQQDMYLEIVVGAGGLIAAALYGMFNKIFVIIAQILLMAVRVIFVIYDAATANGAGAAYNLTNLLQTFFSAVVNLATTSVTVTSSPPLMSTTRTGLDPESAAIHAGGQFLLGAVCYGIQGGSLLPV